MKVSTKGRYALRFMIDLSIHKDDGLISLKEVAQRQDISIKYLEQIVSPLSRAGFIRSVRGAQGGYCLTKTPSEYTPLDVLEVVEGPIACVTCLETQKNICPRYSECPTVGVYEGLNKVIKEYLNSMTLQDLADENKDRMFNFTI